VSDSPNTDDIAHLDRFDCDTWARRLAHPSKEMVKWVREPSLYRKSLERVQKLCAALKEAFVQKDELIDLMAWCSTAHLPMLMLGPWGTGKSMLVRTMAKALGIQRETKSMEDEDLDVEALRRTEPGAAEPQGESAAPGRAGDDRYFEYLVTRFTTPEEILGPVNIDVLLRHSRHFRQTKGLMPRAEIVFLDEVFKANSAILNALLSIINERVFHNAGRPWMVNLVMLFAASNEPPQEEDLGAFFDRFPVRALCDSVGPDHIGDLLQRSHAHQFQSLEIASESDTKPPSVGHLACINDFRLLRLVSLYNFGGKDTSGKESPEFRDTFLRVFGYLRDQFEISDRSLGHYYRLARARALLQGREILLPEDCRVLQFCARDMETARQMPGIVDEYLT
jgi:MoxR-like ATPase